MVSASLINIFLVVLIELDITDYGMEEDERDYLLKRLDFFSFFIFKIFSILFSYLSFKIMIKLHLLSLF